MRFRGSAVRRRSPNNRNAGLPGASCGHASVTVDHPEAGMYIGIGTLILIVILILLLT